jgi:GNAT superfamily N-acetyltransferase
VTIAIRPAGRDDRPFVLATVERLGAFGPPPWRTAEEIGEADARVLRAFFESPAPGATLLVAEAEEGAPLGFIYLEVLRDYFIGEEHGHVGILAVAAQAEGRGAGGALMRAAEDWARERGYRRLTLNVFERNVRARVVYTHLGYGPETMRYVKFLDGQGRKEGAVRGEEPAS